LIVPLAALSGNPFHVVHFPLDAINEPILDKPGFQKKPGEAFEVSTSATTAHPFYQIELRPIRGLELRLNP